MASTAEELASQAQQLQGSIAFFKVGATTTAPATAPAAKKAGAPARAVNRSPASAPARNGRNETVTIALGETRNGPKDSRDSEFENY
jgi:methyl-accepting chemotaxis protein